jgi:hypothetical protein
LPLWAGEDAGGLVVRGFFNRIDRRFFVLLFVRWGGGFLDRIEEFTGRGDSGCWVFYRINKMAGFIGGDSGWCFMMWLFFCGVELMRGDGYFGWV